jgi:PAS domain S-box-containing protein
MLWSKIQDFFKLYVLALVPAIILFGLTLLTFWEMYSRVEERNNALFRLRSETARTAIEKRMYDYIQILKGAQALFVVTDSINRQDWRDYVALLNIDENYPGVQGIGYTAYFGKAYLDTLEEQLRREGFTEFNVWPEDERNIYTSILYLEPFNNRNRRAFGYDMFTEPSRRQAMERARDTGEPSLSRTVTLVQETEVGVQKGFNLYLPLYKRGAALERIEDRKEHLTGFVYSPFRINDLMRGILGNRFSELYLEIYDSDSRDEEALFYQSQALHAEGDYDHKLSITLPIEIAGRKWLLYVAPGPEFGYSKLVSWIILFGGMLMSLLIFLILFSLINSRRSNYLKQLITDNATAALFILTREDYCTFVNPAAENLTGYSPEDFKNTTLHSLVHHSHPDGSPFPAHECPIIRALNTTGILQNQESIFIRKDGSLVHVLLNAQPIYNSGSVGSFLLEVHDISQQKEAELALRSKNKNLKTLNRIGKELAAELDLANLLQSITDSCTDVTEAEFGALFYNQIDHQNNRVLRYALSEFNTDAFRPFTTPSDMAAILDKLSDRVLMGEEEIRQDAPPAQRQSGIRHILAHLPINSFLSVPIRSREGEVLGALVFGHSQEAKFSDSDVEIVKGIASQAAIALDNSRLFETIRHQNEELFKINNDLDNFVYTASHDLKSPVLNIEGLVYALEAAQKRNKPERVGEILEKIQLSILKFKETIQALTEVARTNKNLQEDVETFDLNLLLADVLMSIEDIIHKSGSQISTELGCSQVRFSKAGMSSILLNLITNSIKYRSPQREPHIYIRCCTEEGGIVLEVKDNGLGIPEEHLSKIYTMFRRYHTHVDGSGIGLYLVKRIVDNHGGSIEVKSELDEGTCFRIHLPQ